MMIMEKLDIILLIAGGVLVIISIVINFVSSARIGKLSESINQFEAKFETNSAHDKVEGHDDSRAGQSGITNDSSGQSVSDHGGSDSRTGTRYRPPGSGVKPPDMGPSEEGSGSILPKHHTAIAKAGVRLPADEGPNHDHETPVSEEKNEPEPSAEKQREPLSNSELHDMPAQKTIASLKSEMLSMDDQALIQDYLRNDTEIKGENVNDYAADLVQLKSSYSSEGSSQDGDVMEVVEDTRAMQSPTLTDIKEEDESINPYDPNLMRIDLGKAGHSLKFVNKGVPLILDFKNVTSLSEDETAMLIELNRKCIKQEVPLSIKNVHRVLKNDLHSRIAEIKFI